MKSNVLLFLIIFLFPLKGMAQDQPAIDSLLQVLAEVKEDTSKIRALIELGDQYRYVLPDSALYYLTEALEISNKINSAHSKLHVIEAWAW